MILILLGIGWLISMSAVMLLDPCDDLAVLYCFIGIIMMVIGLVC